VKGIFDETIVSRLPLGGGVTTCGSSKTRCHRN
jgi:hypothetical protein